MRILLFLIFHIIHATVSAASITPPNPAEPSTSVEHFDHPNFALIPSVPSTDHDGASLLSNAYECHGKTYSDNLIPLIIQQKCGPLLPDHSIMQRAAQAFNRFSIFDEHTQEAITTILSDLHKTHIDPQTENLCSYILFRIFPHHLVGDCRYSYKRTSTQTSTAYEFIIKGAVTRTLHTTMDSEKEATLWLITHAIWMQHQRPLISFLSTILFFTTLALSPELNAWTTDASGLRFLVKTLRSPTITVSITDPDPPQDPHALDPSSGAPGSPIIIDDAPIIEPHNQASDADTYAKITAILTSKRGALLPTLQTMQSAIMNLKKFFTLQDSTEYILRALLRHIKAQWGNPQVQNLCGHILWLMLPTHLTPKEQQYSFTPTRYDEHTTLAFHLKSPSLNFAISMDNTTTTEEFWPIVHAIWAQHKHPLSKIAFLTAIVLKSTTQAWQTDVRGREFLARIIGSDKAILHHRIFENNL